MSLITAGIIASIEGGSATEYTGKTMPEIYGPSAFNLEADDGSYEDGPDSGGFTSRAYALDWSMPSDFIRWETLTYYFRAKLANTPDNDIHALSLQLESGDGLDDLTRGPQGNSDPGDEGDTGGNIGWLVDSDTEADIPSTPRQTSVVVAANADDQTMWENGRMIIEFRRDQQKSPDSNFIQIDQVIVSGTYTGSDPP